jgi:hypothetical protein
VKEWNTLPVHNNRGSWWGSDNIAEWQMSNVKLYVRKNKTRWYKWAMLSYMLERTRRDDDDICFVLDQHTELAFYSASTETKFHR